MSWVTAIWAALMVAYAAIAFPHLLMAIFLRRAVDLFFALAVASVIAIAALELTMMHSRSVEQFATALRWTHLPVFVLVVAIVGFVHLYFGTGRLWIGIAACFVRFVCLVVNFAFPPNLNFREITGLQGVHFLGETVSTPAGVISPWTHVGELSSLLGLAFVVDTLLGLWRKGKAVDRRLAVTVGASIIFFIVLATAGTALIHLKVIRVPYHVSVPFVGVIVVMALECYERLGAMRTSQSLRASEALLHESETRFGRVADAAPVMIWMAGPDKLCTFFNKAWLEFSGRTMAQELGNGWSQGVHPDDFEGCLKTYVSAFEALEPFFMTYRLRRRDGKYRYVTDTGVPRYGSKGKFRGYIGACVDVTDMLEKERTLRESEERMRLALEAANLGLWEWNFSKDELWGTKERRALIGLPSSGKIGLEDALSRVHADDRDRVREVMKDAARTGKDYQCEYRILYADGSIHTADLRGRSGIGEDGKTVVVRGVVRDVTKRKQAEELFRLATEASPSGVLLVNDQGNIVLVNAHVEELFGYGREELIGKPEEILVPDRIVGGHPALRAGFLVAPETRPLGRGRELFARRKDGTEFPVEIRLNPIQTPEGILNLATIVDLSAPKLAEEEARRHRDEINRLTRIASLGEMTAWIAHELSQPLAGIISNATAGRRFINRGDRDPDKLLEILVDIAADGRRAHDVISTIRNSLKKGGVARRRLNLNDVVTRVTHMMRPDALAHSCELKVSLAKNLPPTEGDPVQIQQVLINLVSNAFDAMRQTPVRKRKVEISTEQNGDGATCVSVRDHGTGISDETREQIFNQFFTTKKEGIGLGLAIVRSIIEDHRGTIGVENVAGGGARFYFILPASSKR